MKKLNEVQKVFIGAGLLIVLIFIAMLIHYKIDPQAFQNAEGESHLVGKMFRAVSPIIAHSLIK